MVRSVRRDVGQDRATGHAEGLAAGGGASDHLIKRAAASLGGEFAIRIMQQSKQLLGCSPFSEGLQSRARFRPRQRFGQSSHRTDDVRDRVVKRPGPDVKSPVELLV